MNLFYQRNEDDPWAKPKYARPRIIYKEEQNMKDIDKEQAMKELDKLKKEFDERTKKLEEIINQEEKESVVWKPKVRDIYFFNLSRGVEMFDWKNDVVDNYRFSIGNCYKTEQEAIDARDAQIILTDMQRMADEANGGRLRGVEYGQDVYVLFAHHSTIPVAWTRTDNMVIKNMYPCFKRQKEALKAKDVLIQKYGEDKVKRALSGVWR